MLLLLFSLFIIDVVVLVVKLETTKLLDFEINISSGKQFSTSISLPNPRTTHIPFHCCQFYWLGIFKQQTINNKHHHRNARHSTTTTTKMMTMAATTNVCIGIYELDMEYLGGKVFAFLIDTNYQNSFQKGNKEKNTKFVYDVFSTQIIQWNVRSNEISHFTDSFPFGSLRNDDEVKNHGNSIKRKPPPEVNLVCENFLL